MSQISVRGETYEEIRAIAKRRGCTISKVATDLINNELDYQECNANTNTPPNSSKSSTETQ